MKAPTKSPAELLAPGRALQWPVVDLNAAYPDAARTVRATYVPDRGPDDSVRGLVVPVQDITAEASALQNPPPCRKNQRNVVTAPTLVSASGATRCASQFLPGSPSESANT